MLQWYFKMTSRDTHARQFYGRSGSVNPEIFITDTQKSTHKTVVDKRRRKSAPMGPAITTNVADGPKSASLRPRTLTNQILACAKKTGSTENLPFLVEDAKKLHQKLLTLSTELGLSQVGPTSHLPSTSRVVSWTREPAWRPCDHIVLFVCW